MRASYHDPIGYRAIDVDEEWPTLEGVGLSKDSIEKFLESCESAEVDGQNSNSMELSPDQQRVVDIFEAQLNAQTEHVVKRVLVQGAAGTGKSAIVNYIRGRLDKEAARLQLDSPMYEVMAPTGIAASNVSGNTIHTALKISTDRLARRMNGAELNKFRLQFEHVKFIIIDEYSMIGMRLLQSMHFRLVEASGVYDYFGGFNIFFFGDMRQLPPVNDYAAYEYSKISSDDIYAMDGFRKFNSIQAKIILTTIHRHDESQSHFSTILNNLAAGKITKYDYSWLGERFKSSVEEEAEFFSEEAHLFATNEKAANHNHEILRGSGRVIAPISCLHTGTASTMAIDDPAESLEDTLYLFIGARVMLRANLCVSRGLSNGALGTVTNILYDGGVQPPEMPYVVMVKFDDYAGPFLQDTSFPVRPVTAPWYSRDSRRKQFPLHLAYGLTIHKAQGLSLDKATIDLGDEDFTAELIYTALSRVKTLEGLMIASYISYGRFDRIGRKESPLNRRESFMFQHGLTLSM